MANPMPVILALATVVYIATPAAAHQITVLGRTVELPPPVRAAPPGRPPRCEPRPALLTPMLTAQIGLQAADTGLTHYGLTLPASSNATA